MELFEFTSELELDFFLKTQPGGSLLESWSWGEVLQSGKTVVKRFGVKENGIIILAATVIKKDIGAGFFYWLIPRGPVVGKNSAEDKVVLDFFFSQLAKYDGQALFIRFEPLTKPEQYIGNFQIVKTINLEPAETLVLDLKKEEAELLADMHPKTRYNIRLAEKKGVLVEQKNNPSDFDLKEFQRLMNLTGSRDGFRLHAASHYLQLIKKSRGKIKLWLAVYKGQNIAAGLFSVWEKQATYLHGASDNKFRSLMAPQLLQWAVIKEARAGGCQSYDFYGIDAEKWPGVTRFKLGFGGSQIKFPGTYDAILDPFKYNLYKLLRKLRRTLG